MLGQLTLFTKESEYFRGRFHICFFPHLSFPPICAKLILEQKRQRYIFVNLGLVRYLVLERHICAFLTALLGLHGPYYSSSTNASWGSEIGRIPLSMMVGSVLWWGMSGDGGFPPRSLE